MKILMAADHGAYQLKNRLKKHLTANKHIIVDLGVNDETSVDYPDIAVRAAAEFKKNSYDFGIVMCGTGIGISMAANKIKGIRCALLHGIFDARMAKAHNNANFIALGGRIKYHSPAEEIVDTFIKSSFDKENARHAQRINKITALEGQNG
ncbi:MAG TPA: RpiB/LacA/LacB family sugar-phosphate isomerase [Spirochaetota bacterium]|nr:RpiB/LacA/LacB family sugar-phosphate isomerase [Spirochaetota bacterium]